MEESIESLHIRLDKNVLDLTQKARNIKKKNEKLDSMKTKFPIFERHVIKKIKRQITDWEKWLQNT